MTRRIGVFVLALALATAFVLVVLRPDSSGPTAAESPAGAGTDLQVDRSTDRSEPSTVRDRAPDEPADDDSGQSEPGAAPAIDGIAGRLAAEAPLPPDDELLLVEVVRLADGDSFDIRWVDPRPDTVRRDEVRMLGINAPETTACFGPDARRVLDQLIGDGPVLIDIAEDEWDDFGRAIADVWNIDGVLVNVAMVELGAALAVRDGGHHADRIAQAQVAAKSERIGLWRACDAESDLAIVDLRADAPGRDDLNPNGEWIEIANLGDGPADLTGWGLRDESTRHRFVFPEGYLLDGGAVVRIGSGCDWHDGADQVDLTWCGEDPIWNNGGDTAFLVDPDGRFADEWSYAG